ncbi:hypothetical protein ACFWP5_03790 [Streptomyces sp. NPDC058469]|uniref:hypothetical protein n=1 Tax=Streptomyces sp. NPDC058469 TaxID=3346514 RepID=UPI00364EAA98
MVTEHTEYAEYAEYAEYLEYFELVCDGVPQADAETAVVALREAGARAETGERQPPSS